ncbi:MAG: GHMP kinase, partial [Nitrospirota bacterium]
LLNALYVFQGKVVSKERLAQEACEIEIDILGEPIGKQDQYAAAYGNINHIQFNRDETVAVTPILLTESAKMKLENSLCLYYAGGKRSTREILTEQRDNISRKDKFENLEKIVSLVDALRDALHEGRIDDVGEILHRGWLFKKDLASGISRRDIDILYNRAMERGAKGGKLLGAGGTGFLLIYSENHESLKKYLGRRTLPFRLDREGTKILFYE